MTSVETIYNFKQLDDNLATGGQPEETQLHAIATAGYEVVINLGLSDAPYAIPDERAILETHGLRYEQIPVSFQSPQAEDLQQFTSLFKEVRHRKVFVHCAANKRVSVFIALYRVIEQGWDEERALEDVHAIWQPDRTWSDFMQNMLSAGTD